mgnify:CR=1 FL=1
MEGGLILQSGGGGLIGWLLANPEIGWVAVILYLMWEIRGPWGKINELMKLIKSVITVVRGLARVHDDVDTETVDDYLVENGMEPGDFIRKDDDNEDLGMGDPEDIVDRGDD